MLLLSAWAVGDMKTYHHRRGPAVSDLFTLSWFAFWVTLWVVNNYQ